MSTSNDLNQKNLLNIYYNIKYYIIFVNIIKALIKTINSINKYLVNNILKIIKNTISNNFLLSKIAYRIFFYLSKIRIFLGYFDFLLNHIKIFFNKTVTMRGFSLYRSNDQKKSIKKILNRQIIEFKKKKTLDDVFVCLEIGSLLGENIKNMGDLLSSELENFLIISIDPYEDYINKTDRETNNILKIRANYTNTFYKYLMHNLSLLNYREKIIQFRDYSSNGLKLLKKINLKCDLVYIDGAHYYKNIKEDYELANEIIKKENIYSGTICGDDYSVNINEYKHFGFLTKSKFIDYLETKKENEFTEIKKNSNGKYKITGFHPGITLYFAETQDNILRLKNGIWLKKNKK